MEEQKQLYRSDSNKVCAGVMGGVAEYYSVDPVIVRLVAVFIIIVTGIVPLALIYLLSVIVIPKRV
jgi:phage shock protein C